MPSAVEKLRKKAFVRAVIAVALIVITEIAAHFVLKVGNHTVANNADFIKLTSANHVSQDSLNSVTHHQPPGMAISYLGLTDGLLLLTMLLMVLSMVLPREQMGRLQGPGTLIGMILFVIASIVLAIIAVVKLLLMVTLFLAAPFGTITYLLLFGNFDTRGATLALAVIMALKLFCCVQLVIAQQRFLQMKGLLALVLTSLVCTLMIGFLHGIVPTVLVSITDALAAVILAIVAIIWGVILLIGSLVAIVRTV